MPDAIWFIHNKSWFYFNRFILVAIILVNEPLLADKWKYVNYIHSLLELLFINSDISLMVIAFIYFFVWKPINFLFVFIQFIDVCVFSLVLLRAWQKKKYKTAKNAIIRNTEFFFCFQSFCRHHRSDVEIKKRIRVWRQTLCTVFYIFLD